MLLVYRRKLLVAMLSFVMVNGMALSLKLQELRITEHILSGDRPNLLCRWTLEPGETLYSVKWYKDGREFFRYVPKGAEKRRNYSLPGVNVEESDECGSGIVLSAANRSTRGRYRCEVSGEKPHFHTVSDHRDMKVIIPPESGPTISGFQSKYSIGDGLQLTCSSAASDPPCNLTWYINGEPLSLEVKPSYHIKYNLGITTISLSHRLEEVNFDRHLLRVKCLATIQPMYWRSIEEVATLQELNTIEENVTSISSFKSRKFRSSSRTIEADFRLILLMFIKILT